MYVYGPQARHFIKRNFGSISHSVMMYYSTLIQYFFKVYSYHEDTIQFSYIFVKHLLHYDSKIFTFFYIAYEKERQKDRQKISRYFLLQKITCDKNQSDKYCGPKEEALYIIFNDRYGRTTSGASFNLWITVERKSGCKYKYFINRNMRLDVALSISLTDLLSNQIARKMMCLSVCPFVCLFLSFISCCQLKGNVIL